MKRKFLRLFKYVIFNKYALKNLQSQLKLLFVINYFNREKLVHLRTNLYHLTDYLSGAFTTDEKAQILCHHYRFLRETFNTRQLKLIFNDGVEFFREENDNGTYSIVLNTSSTLEFEGSLSIFLKFDDIKIATLSFSIAPGSIFSIDEEHVAYITCTQRIGQHKPRILAAIKHFRDIVPSVLLMKSFEAMLTKLNIHSCIGISYKNQLTALKNNEDEKYFSFYDALWMNYGGIDIGGNYLIPLPLGQKPLILIKQTHRNRTVKKRQKMREIYDSTIQKMVAFLDDPI
ncbi:DUF535 family protein [Mucilaginibacter sp.]